MRIKKFIAKSLKEGKSLIIKELGEDAIILSSRTAKQPTGEDFFEIVAAIDDQPTAPSHPKLHLPVHEKKSNIQIKDKTDMENDSTQFLQAASRIFDEIGSLKDKLNEISDDVRYKYSGVMGDIAGSLFKSLRKADIEEQFALNIIGQLSSQGKLNDGSEAIKAAREIITGNIKIYPQLQKGPKCKTVAFIGINGCGKTLTLIKLAVVCKLIMKPDLLIVGADTYKVGGAEQLETFSSIATIPFLTAYTPQELNKLILREYSRDFIFIDTVGRSQQNDEHLDEIKGYLDASDADVIFLVQDATVSESTFNQILKKYSILKPDALILTKLDEAATLGGIVGALMKNPIPVAYFANGHRIPEDIEPADKKKFGEMILTESLKDWHD